MIHTEGIKGNRIAGLYLLTRLQDNTSKARLHGSTSKMSGLKLQGSIK